MALPTDAEIFEKAMSEAADWGPPRCRFVEAALALDGLSYENPETRDRYVEELFLNQQDFGPDGPTEADRKQAYGFASAMSSCGITTQAIWAAAGVDLAYLRKPYKNRIGSAVTFEYKYAKEVGAWVNAMPWKRGTPFPEAGDAMIIGDNTPAFARGSSPTYQHELNVICWVEGPRGALMGGLDGGQPGIAIRTRGLVEVFPNGGDLGELWCSVVAPDGSLPLGADGRPLSGRRALGFTDVTRLPFVDNPPACQGGGLLRTLAVVAGGVAVGLGALAVTGNCPCDSIKKGLRKISPF